MYVAVVHELEPTSDQSPEEGQLSLEVCDGFGYFYVKNNPTLPISTVLNTTVFVCHAIGCFQISNLCPVSIFLNLRYEKADSLWSIGPVVLIYMADFTLTTFNKIFAYLVTSGISQTFPSVQKMLTLYFIYINFAMLFCVCFYVQNVSCCLLFLLKHVFSLSLSLSLSLSSDDSRVWSSAPIGAARKDNLPGCLQWLLHPLWRQEVCG